MGIEDLQKNLDEIIRDVISPILKQQGFKKSGRNYYKGVQHFGLCFNVQTSRHNNENEVEFTFNTGVIFPEVYKHFYPEMSLSSFPKEYECVQRTRIGQLLGKPDLWYRLKRGQSIHDISLIVKRDIENYVVPYFEKFTSDDDILHMVEIGYRTGAPNEDALFAGFCILHGSKALGEKILKNHYLSINSKEIYKARIEKYGAILGVELK